MSLVMAEVGAQVRLRKGVAREKLTRLDPATAGHGVPASGRHVGSGGTIGEPCAPHDEEGMVARCAHDSAAEADRHDVALVLLGMPRENHGCLPAAGSHVV